GRRTGADTGSATGGYHATVLRRILGWSPGTVGTGPAAPGGRGNSGQDEDGCPGDPERDPRPAPGAVRAGRTAVPGPALRGCPADDPAPGGRRGSGAGDLHA